MSKAKSRVGSSKQLISSGTEGRLYQVDLGTSSVFDLGQMPHFVSARLAEARTLQAAAIFQRLQMYGIDTHFQKWVSLTGLLVSESQVGNKPLLSGRADHTMIGLEILFRWRISEKFLERIKAGEIDEADIQLAPFQRLQPGALLGVPYIEASTKWEKVDRYLQPAEAAKLTGLDTKMIEALFAWATGIARGLGSLFDDIGFDLVDGKLEVAYDARSEGFVLIDAITLDELGVIRNGKHYGKNLLRDYYRTEEREWYEQLQQAQRDHSADPSKWPTYPRLPKNIREMHVRRYVRVAELLDAHVAELIRTQ